MGVSLHLDFISAQLWAFVGNHLTPTLDSRRLSLAGGEDYNGLEQWRKLYLDNEGVAEQVTLAGIRRFHAFEKRKPKSKLGVILENGNL